MVGVCQHTHASMHTCAHVCWHAHTHTHSQLGPQLHRRNPQLLLAPQQPLRDQSTELCGQLPVAKGGPIYVGGKSRQLSTWLADTSHPCGRN